MLFREITLADRASVERLRDPSRLPLTAYAFPALYLWRNQLQLKVAVSAREEPVAVYSDAMEGWFYPFGTQAACDTFIKELTSSASAERPVRFLYLNKAQAEKLESMGYTCSIDRDSEEYIYLSDILAAPSGSNGKNLRRKLSAFQKETEYTARAITPADAPLLREIAEDWSTQHSDTSDLSITLDAIDHMEALGITGILLEAPKGSAFILGYPNGPELFTFTIVKYASTLSANAVAACIYEYAAQIAPQVKYIDLEEDMGLEGLRQMKTAYHPAHLLEAYTAVLSGGIQHE